MSEVKETRKRALFKTITWRLFAILNSWTILSFVTTGSNFYKAVVMNISGFVVFYVFERLWSKVKYGRYIENK